MSVWLDMASDGGYSDEEAQQVAWILEQQARDQQALAEAELEAEWLARLEAERG